MRLPWADRNIATFVVNFIISFQFGFSYRAEHSMNISTAASRRRCKQPCWTYPKISGMTAGQNNGHENIKPKFIA